MSAQKENNTQTQSSSMLSTEVQDVQSESLNGIKQIINAAPAIDLPAWKMETQNLLKNKAFLTEKTKDAFCNMRVSLFENLAQECKVSTNSIKIIDILLKMGMVSYVMQEYQAACEYLGEAQDMCTQMITECPMNELQSLLDDHMRPVQFISGLTYHSIGRTDEAVKCLRSLLEFCGPLPDITTLVFYTLGTIYNEQGKFPEALYYLKRSEALEKSQNFGKITLMKALILKEKGDIYSSKEIPQLVKTINNYDEALNMAISLNLEHWKPLFSYNIGKAFQDQSKLEEAVCWYILTIEACANLNISAEVELVILANGNLGDIHYSEGDFKEALKYYNEAQLLLKANASVEHEVKLAELEEKIHLTELQKMSIYQAETAAENVLPNMAPDSSESSDVSSVTGEPSSDDSATESEDNTGNKQDITNVSGESPDIFGFQV